MHGIHKLPLSGRGYFTSKGVWCMFVSSSYVWNFCRPTYDAQSVPHNIIMCVPHIHMCSLQGRPGCWLKWPFRQIASGLRRWAKSCMAGKTHILTCEQARHISSSSIFPSSDGDIRMQNFFDDFQLPKVVLRNSVANPRGAIRTHIFYSLAQFLVNGRAMTLYPNGSGSMRSIRRTWQQPARCPHVRHRGCLGARQRRGRGGGGTMTVFCSRGGVPVLRMSRPCWASE